MKSGSHLNLSLCYEIDANHNDVIVLWSTFVNVVAYQKIIV
jgi:hypothetical protein